MVVTRWSIMTNHITTGSWISRRVEQGAIMQCGRILLDHFVHNQLLCCIFLLFGLPIYFFLTTAVFYWTSCFHGSWVVYVSYEMCALNSSHCLPSNYVIPTLQVFSEISPPVLSNIVTYIFAPTYIINSLLYCYSFCLYFGEIWKWEKVFNSA